MTSTGSVEHTPDLLDIIPGQADQPVDIADPKLLIQGTRLINKQLTLGQNQQILIFTRTCGFICSFLKSKISILLNFRMKIKFELQDTEIIIKRKESEGSL